MESYIYVDYENMANLKKLPEIANGKYFIFLGANQLSVPKSLVIASNEKKVEWIEIDGNGKNALDFHIAYYLAKNDEKKDVRHYILSKDKGFDPLVSTINKMKKAPIVKRISDINDADIAKQTNNKGQQNSSSSKISKYEKLKKNLADIEKSKRPKSETTLKTHISATIKNLEENELQKLLEKLYQEKIISKGKKNRISYSI